MTRKKVLWVDDEIEFLRSHIMFLETRGYSVTPVFNGDDALHILNEQPQGFDIVLLDEQMPGMDGLTVLQEIKDMLPDLPVVMVTKSEEEHVMEDALGKKIDGYLTKPVNPSQILLVCKRILDSRNIISTQITQRFVRNFSEIKTALQGSLDAKAWTRVYDNLVKWDIELENVEDEGIRQAHAGQRSDANVYFSDFFIENYVRWLKGGSGSPVFSPKIVETFLVPQIKLDKKVCFMVFDCLRLDQFLVIEPLLRRYFNIDRHLYYSCIPSSPVYTENMLFGGEFAEEFALKNPGAFTSFEPQSQAKVNVGGVLLCEKLRSCGIETDGEYEHVSIGDVSAGREVLAKIDDFADRKLISVDVNSADLLLQSQGSSTVIQEMASDEIAFRRLTASWFQHSSVFQILREMAARQFTVVLTSGNGSVLCTRGTEIYGDGGIRNNVRFRVGKNITCDERHALFISEPAHFRLPITDSDTSVIILKENYHFVQHDKFENYQKQYSNSFQHGGISLEEVIVPLAVMTPRQEVFPERSYS